MFLQSDDRETDTASESSYSFGRIKKSPSSLTNLSSSSGMASLSSVCKPKHYFNGTLLLLISPILFWLSSHSSYLSSLAISVSFFPFLLHEHNVIPCMELSEGNKVKLSRFQFFFPSSMLELVQCSEQRDGFYPKSLHLQLKMRNNAYRTNIQKGRKRRKISESRRCNWYIKHAVELVNQLTKSHQFMWTSSKKNRILGKDVQIKYLYLYIHTNLLLYVVFNFQCFIQLHIQAPNSATQTLSTNLFVRILRRSVVLNSQALHSARKIS